LIVLSPYSLIFLVCLEVLDPYRKVQYHNCLCEGKKEILCKVSAYHSCPDQLHCQGLLLSISEGPICILLSREPQSLDIKIDWLVTQS
jgi:hypothetical protein